jgi:hypothetical protein
MGYKGRARRDQRSRERVERQLREMLTGEAEHQECLYRHDYYRARHDDYNRDGVWGNVVRE